MRGPDIISRTYSTAAMATPTLANGCASTSNRSSVTKCGIRLNLASAPDTPLCARHP